MLRGFKARGPGARISSRASVPSILDRQRAPGFRLDSLRRLDIARGGANDDVWEKIAAFDGGLRVEKLDALDLRGGGGEGLGGGGGGWGGGGRLVRERERERGRGRGREHGGRLGGYHEG